MNRIKLKADSQYLIPKHLLTRLVGFFAGAKMGGLTTAMIKSFIKHYKINTKEIIGKPEEYKTFNDFFARQIQPDARPINMTDNVLVFPADGKISQFGAI